MTQNYANQEVSYLVIGAGIAGLSAAQALQNAGHRVQVLDKGRGVGGRMATRRIEAGVFDHGAQYFSVRDTRFQEMVTRWQGEGVVQEWARGFPAADGGQKTLGSPRYRGAPGMTGIPKALAEGLDIHLSSRVEAVSVRDGLWEARTDSGEVFRGEALILTPPVPQSLLLLKKGAFDLPSQIDRELQRVSYHPCIALLILLEKPAQIPAPGGVRVREGALRWIADNQQKGVSPDAPAVTIHASPDFSRQAWDFEDKKILDRLLAEAGPWIQGPVRAFQIQRWRYAQPVDSYPSPEVVRFGPPLIFAGDAFRGGRVEGAALSGLDAADWLIQQSVVS